MSTEIKDPVDTNTNTNTNPETEEHKIESENKPEEQLEGSVQQQEENAVDPEQDDLKSPSDPFDKFDTGKEGKIRVENLYEIAADTGKNTNNVDDALKRLKKSKTDTLSRDEYEQIMADLDRPNISAMESQFSQRSQRIVVTPDPKVIEFIRLLHAFQQKCETEGKYSEAKLSVEKIEDIRIKEIIRQENNIRAFQEEELAQVENAQKEQFIEFNKVWDQYMADYEATALSSLEKLKEKHIREVEELHDRLKKELAFHFKPSKQLIELRQREGALVKIQKYNEAEKVKAQADTLEDFERGQKENEIEDIIDKKTQILRTQQQRALTVLLKRIQKDRNQQLKNRDSDSQKLILKNRNLRNELLSKHTSEAKNALEVIKSNLSISNILQAEKNSQRKSASTTSQGRASQNESPVKIDTKKGEGEK